MPAVDVSPWLRSDALCSADRLFSHVSGRAKTASQVIPGRPCSFVAVLEPGAISWTATLDAVRLGPVDDETAVTAVQPEGVLERLSNAGQWQAGDPDIVIVGDAGYDVLPVLVLGSRGFRNIRAPLACPSRVPKPRGTGPGRPPPPGARINTGRADGCRL